MEIILALAITWYATKVYYTKSLKLSMPASDPNLVQIQCHKCAQTVVTHKDNLRAPFYCLVCK